MEEGAAAPEDYKDVVGICREKIRWVKAQQELDLAAVKGNKNRSANKSSAKDSVGHWKMCNLTTAFRREFYFYCFIGMIKINFKGAREPFKEEKDKSLGQEGI